MFQPKIFLIFNSGGHYFSRSETICAIVVDGIILFVFICIDFTAKYKIKVMSITSEMI